VANDDGSSEQHGGFKKCGCVNFLLINRQNKQKMLNRAKHVLQGSGHLMETPV
jgi:hypothetical protein